MSKRVLSAVLSSAMILASVFTGCAADVRTVKYSDKTTNLMDGIIAQNPDTDIGVLTEYEKYCDFAVNLLRSNLKDNQNITVSPASVIFALAMTANGAGGKTNEEMLALFNEYSNKELNFSLYQYMQSIQDDASGVKIANSIWINEDIRFEESKEFLQTNADYYSSDIFSAPFDDSTAKDINKWVYYNTNGGIPELVKKIDSGTVMCLINTVLFDAQWLEPFDANNSAEGEFNNANGTKAKVKMMNSEYERYISDDNTNGFIKEYSNGYAFAALLPKEGISMEEYLENFTAEQLRNLLSQDDDNEVAVVAIPAFKNRNELNLNKSLQAMGMKTAFDSNNADFSKMGTSHNGELYVDSVTQNTEITVDELGTKASAATKVEMKDGAMLVENSVICDRPFVYFIVDGSTKMPLFAGAFMSAE